MKNKIVIWTVVIVGLVIIVLKGKDFFRSILVNNFKKRFEEAVAEDEKSKIKIQETLKQIEEVEKRLGLVNSKIEEVEKAEDENWHLKKEKK